MLDINSQADDQKLLAQVIDYYHRTLKETTEGLDYLRSRGVTVGEAIDRFRIGYANRTLGLKLPVNGQQGGPSKSAPGCSNSASTGAPAANTSTAASCSQSRPPMAAGRSWTSTGGRHATIFARARRLHMHLSDQRRGVWNVEAFRPATKSFSVPALWDALTFWNAGYRNVTCTFGPDALTDDHLAAFREFGIRRVLADVGRRLPRSCWPPGWTATSSLAARHRRERYALQADDPSQALGAIIRKAEWLGKGNRPCRCRVGCGSCRQPGRRADRRSPSRPAEPEADAWSDRRTGRRTTTIWTDLDDDEWEEMEDEADDLDDDGRRPNRSRLPPSADRPAAAAAAPILIALRPCRRPRKRSKPT